MSLVLLGTHQLLPLLETPQSSRKILLQTKYYSVEVNLESVDVRDLESSLSRADAIIVEPTEDNSELKALEEQELGDYVCLVVSAKVIDVQYRFTPYSLR